MDEKIVWQIPEHEYLQKNAAWRAAIFAAAAGLIIFAFWQKNFLFAVFTAIAFWTVIYLTEQPPTVWEMKINKNGVLIKLPNSEEGGKFYKMADIESFDIYETRIASDETESKADEQMEIKKIAFKFKQKFSPYLKINIYKRDEEKIKKFLLNFIQQKEYEKSVFDSLSEFIGF